MRELASSQVVTKSSQADIAICITLHNHPHIYFHIAVTASLKGVQVELLKDILFSLAQVCMWARSACSRPVAPEVLNGISTRVSSAKDTTVECETCLTISIICIKIARALEPSTVGRNSEQERVRKWPRRWHQSENDR